MVVTTTSLVSNLDSRTIAGVADGGAVTNQMLDQSGHSNHGVVTNAVLKAIGNNRYRKPSLFFNSVNSTLTITNPGVTLNNMTLFVVARPSDPSASFVVGGGAGTSNGMMQQFSGFLKSVAGPTSAVLGSPNQNVGAGCGQTVLYATRIGGAATRLTLNQTSEDTASAQAATALGDIQIGWNVAFGAGGGGFTIAGEICEVALYNAAISDADYALNAAALVQKWGCLPLMVLAFCGDSRMDESNGLVPRVVAAAMGQGFWSTVCAVAGQTILQMIANDPAKLDAMLAGPGGVAGANFKGVLAWELVNEIFNGRTQAQALTNMNTYYTTVVKPRSLAFYPCTEISEQIVTNDNASGAVVFNPGLKAAYPGTYIDIAANVPYSQPTGYLDGTRYKPDFTHLLALGDTEVGAIIAAKLRPILARLVNGPLSGMGLSAMGVGL